MVKEIGEKNYLTFDKLATHPLQTIAWGEFRKKTGVGVSRFIRLRNRKTVETAQITWHKIPHLPWSIGYWPKGIIPSAEMVLTIASEAKKHRALMVKMEPNEIRDQRTESRVQGLKRKVGLVRGRSLFTRWSFLWDISKAEEELLGGMKQKTRYNVRLAEKKGVRIIEDNSSQGFEDYWKLMEETTARQGFFAHTKKYHQQMFETLSKAGIAHLFKAIFEEKVLTTWVVFNLNGVLYYPYGASTREDSNVFASNLMMWEVAKWGKNHGCKLFDLWGSPGPNPKPSDAWFGFHKFKEGYNAKLVEFVGTYDLITSPILYWFYRIGEEIRWMVLRLIRH